MTEPRATLVLADDDPAQQVLLRRMLDDSRFDLTFLENGAEVLEHLKHHTPDLLVLDVEMPFLDGLSVTERVRWVPRLEQVPVLIVTAREDPTTLKTIDWVGADAVLHKPLGRARFVATVKRLLAEGRTRRPMVRPDQHAAPEAPEAAAPIGFRET